MGYYFDLTDDVLGEQYGVSRERIGQLQAKTLKLLNKKRFPKMVSVLKQNNQIDFADMINDAHFYLQEIERQNIEMPYK